MKLRAFSISIFAMCAVAHAGFAPLSADGARDGCALAARPTASAAPLLGELPSGSAWQLVWSADVPFGQPAAGRDASDARDGTLHAVGIPAPPSSLALGLSALGCVGAFQLTRSAKRLHLGALPDWYHSAAPAQIGHVKLLDLNAPALFEPTFGCELPSTVRFERAPTARLSVPAPPLIPTRAPRSPPAAMISA